MGICNGKEEKTSTSPSNIPVETQTKKEQTQQVQPAPQKKKVGIEDSYEMGEELGRGGFSIVKKSKSKETGETFAIKFIDRKAVDADALEQLQREIELMKDLDHPNCLKLEEVYQTKESLALVMEYVDGGELFYRIVEKGNYTERDAVKILRQMIQGVQYLHSKNIAHRDLKPENLLCATDNRDEFQPFRVVIADFGLSKNFDNQQMLNTRCGTPDYVAPELIATENNYSEAVDMWSCGVISYVLLCGFSPFASEDETGMFGKILKAEYEFPDPEWTHISDNAKDFISKLLVRDPKQRSTATQALQHPWLNGTGGEGDDEELANGMISERMKSYNERRKTTRKVL